MSKPTDYTLPAQAKAVLAGLIAGGASVATALGDGGLSPAEAVTAGVAALIGYGAVFGVPNAE